MSDLNGGFRGVLGVLGMLYAAWLLYVGGVALTGVAAINNCNTAMADALVKWERDANAITEGVNVCVRNGKIAHAVLDTLQGKPNH